MSAGEGGFQLQCPLPNAPTPFVQLAHGGGGKAMERLIESVFLPHFQNPHLDQRHDGAVLQLAQGRIAFTTDSYVVQPLMFPGGDIGMLAVNGTANDLAMCGARPAFLSAGFILEEGLPLSTLQTVVESMAKAATAAGVQLVTGDTKVVDRGKGDGIYINTAGIGWIENDLEISPRSLREGDAIIVSGDLGRHGIAIMSVREGLEFESVIESDCAPLSDLVLSLIREGIALRCLRDLTRGGLGSALNELAQASAHRIEIVLSAVPVREDVRGACEILGLDPLYVANEGRFIAVVPEREAEQTLKVMRGHPLGTGAAVIGRVTTAGDAIVTVKSEIGVERVLDWLSGEQLPRIC